MSPQLSICTFIHSQSLAQSLREHLTGDRYILTSMHHAPKFFQFIDRHTHQIDCLILEPSESLMVVVNQLYEQRTLLPVVILQPDYDRSSIKISIDKLDAKSVNEASTPELKTYFYHAAEVRLSETQIEQIANYIEQAIGQFLQISLDYHQNSQLKTIDPTIELTAQSLLIQQQRRLAEKLKERLGYLSVYYKRNPEYFFRHLSNADKQQLLENLSSQYREIILDYFSPDNNLNKKIDSFVNLIFFSDVPVAKVVEIHMELMDKFSKHLKLEGRSEDILLDYRLALIDIIAHLCEMYRRSIPRS